MATVSTPVAAYVASIMLGTGVNQSSSTTATIANALAWEIRVPVQCQMSAVSADPVIQIYASQDVGATFDTTPLTAFSIARLSGGGLGQASIRLSGGVYALQLTSSGPNSQTFKILTQEVISAINNV